MVSPTAQQTRIAKWVRRHLPRDGSVSLRDVTSLYTVLYLLGPKSKSLLEEVTGQEVDLQPFTCQVLRIKYVSVDGDTTFVCLQGHFFLLGLSLAQITLLLGLLWFFSSWVPLFIFLKQISVPPRDMQ